MFSTSLIFSFSEWSSSIASCGIFIYTVTDDKNVPLDNSVITYSGVTKTFVVFTNDINKVGTTRIKISGKLGTYSVVDYVFNLFITCDVTTFSPSFSMSDYSYIVKTP